MLETWKQQKRSRPRLGVIACGAAVSTSAAAAVMALAATESAVALPAAVLPAASPVLPAHSLGVVARVRAGQLTLEG